MYLDLYDQLLCLGIPSPPENEYRYSKSISFMSYYLETTDGLPTKLLCEFYLAS